jgi:beta-glucosidase-like glycosyl hydrolase
MSYPKFFTKQDRKVESAEIIGKKIEALLRAMTPEEKLNCCHGTGENPADVGQLGNGGYMPGIPRLGVPEVRMYDGPAGVTSVYETTGLPVQQILASTWSKELAHQFGEVMGSENTSFSGNFQLGAQYDITRIPHFGRSRDMLGEDPVLASELAIQETKGIQEHGAVATLKHFAGYTQSGTPLISADFRVDEQTLHEMYLRPFEAAVAKGGAGSIMCTYNKINGRYAASNPYLHKYVIRDLWDFQGSVMSDWGATHRLCTHLGMDIEMPYGMYNSDERIKKGIAEGKMTWEDVDDAVRHFLYGMASCGYLAMVALDENGEVIPDENHPLPIHTTDTYYEDVKNGLLDRNAEIAYQVDIKGMSLLKNENQMFPLKRGDRVAAIGLGAVHLISGYDQERSFGRINRMVSPAEALAAQLPHVTAAVGIDAVGCAIPGAYLFQDADCTAHGLVRTYGIREADGECPPNFGPGGAGEEFRGVPNFAADEDSDNDDYTVDMGVAICTPNAAADMAGHTTGDFAAVDGNVEFLCHGVDEYDPYHNGPEGTAFHYGDAYTWKGFLRVPETGEYTLAVQAIGGQTAFRIALDGEHFEFVGNTNTRESAHWAWGGIVPTKEGLDIQSKTFHLEAGKTYPVIAFASATMRQKDLQIRLAWITPEQKRKDYAAALQAAKDNDKVLLFVHSKKEAESGMMTFPVTTESLKLDEQQEQLLQDVFATAKAAGNQVAVCIGNSVPVVMEHWIDNADGVVEMWLPGQEGGRAVADLLTGKQNFSGKLAQSLPRNDADTLVTDTEEHRIRRHDGYADENNHLVVDFEEGIFFGYRWYDHEGRTPMFPFGYGLSYTAFELKNAALCTESGITVSVDVTNTGKVPGDEIVQVYLGGCEVPSHVQIADKQLCGFTRVENLQPGETRRVDISIDPRSLCYWDREAAVSKSSWGTKGKWVRTTGSRTLWIGDSSDHLPLSLTIH